MFYAFSFTKSQNREAWGRRLAPVGGEVVRKRVGG
jgi:hypothetical protein